MARIIQTADLDPSKKLSRVDEDWVYNGLDCCVTVEVFHALEAKLDNVSRSTYEFSLALQAPVLEMSMRGVLINRPRRDEVMAKYSGQIKQLDEQLKRLIFEGVGATGTFNWRSNAQVMSLLYDMMQVPPVRKRNVNGLYVPTVDRDALESIEAKYIMSRPIVAHLLVLRDLDKKRQFLEVCAAKDGRSYTSFNIAGTNTGRLASSVGDFGEGRNLQNVDRDLRSVFIPDPGYKFVNIDLEQADARNVAMKCWNLFLDSHGEEIAGSYLRAFESGDLHTFVAKMVWPNLGWTGEPKQDKRIANQLFYRQDSYRQMAKKLGHGTNYYGTPRTMAKHTKVAAGIVEEFQRAYFKAFPCIPLWHEWVRGQLNEERELTTMLGRRRHFFDRPNEDDTLRGAIAYEPQSMTADEIDTGLLKVWRKFPQVQCLLQVHDSILAQVPESQVDDLVPQLIEAVTYKTTLAGGREFSVPAEAKIGWNWGEVEYDLDGKVIGNPLGLIKWSQAGDARRP